ncbi:MAG: leucine-rich repeat domain-containing protein, partial [Oscillospiraceae bacterium]|nr:leucine-rich repeat domain-containing protein [Oscillospiraceae bacterium]
MDVRSRMIGLVLALVLLTAMLPAGVMAVENESGSDIPQESIEVKLADSMNADHSDTFLSSALPDKTIVKENMTRAEWIQNLVLLFGMNVSPDEYPDIYFPDVLESADYYDAIMIAVKNGMIDIEAGDNFEPAAVVSREFAAQTLNDCLGIQKEAEDYTYSDTGTVIHQDDAQVAVEQGWFSLVGGSFMPEKEVTEAEAADMLTAAAEIVDGRKLGDPFSDFEFADFVIVLPDEVEVISDYDFETERTSLMISGYNGELAAGDTIAFFGGDLAFVYSIVTVSRAGDTFIIDAGVAPEGAVLKGEFSGELIPELVFEEPEENNAVSLLGADGQEVVFGPVELMASSNYGKKDFGRKITIGDVTGEIYGTFSNIRLEVSNRRFVLYGTVTAHSTLDIVLAPCPLTSLTLVDVSLLKYGKISLSLELSAEARIGYYFSVDFSIGVDASGGRASLIHTAKTVDSSLTASGTISMLLKLNGRLDFGFVGNASVTLSVGPKVAAASKTYHEGSPKRCTNVTGYLYAGLKASYAFVNIDGVDMGKITDKGRGSFSKDFYTASNSPLRIVEHIEDGVTVHSCTRPNDAGQAESGYSKPKYYTPGNSRYYASGNPNGNSTGIDGNGEPVVIWETSDNGDGTVTVTGYNNATSILNIPETIDGKTVTKIGDKAFQNNKNIRMVYIPNTVTSIGNSAFNGCNYLSNIQIPYTITSIGDYAVAGCALTELVLPSNLSYLGREVLTGTLGVKSLTIPASLSSSYGTRLIGTGEDIGPLTGSRIETLVFEEGTTLILP